MKVLIIACCIALSSASTAIEDDYDWSTILEHNDLLHDYFRCFLDQIPCSSAAAHVKEHVIEMMRDGCAECDATQRHYAQMYFTTLMNTFPEYYQEMKAKYDPEDKYFKTFKKIEK